MYDQIQEEKPKGFPGFIAFIAAIGSFVFGSIEALVTAVALVIVLYLFILTPHEVVGRSMYPTYKDGEILLANKVVYRVSQPKRGDVVIFKHSATEDYIKRIIGLPGDQVSLRDGNIYVNDKILSESDYLSDTIYTDKGRYLDEGDVVSVPDDSVFVCGDNRPHSSDSRDFGPIPITDIKGKVWIVYFPFDHFRVVKHANYE
ncbi:signal peptidase I [Candidatus Dojkabacteria bacterium]|nr:signal peptidase I [Candidatus Dojkabacteria bacterium]